MRSKKLILNVLSILSVVMMTTVMVLSSCGNVADGEHANIRIRLGGSGSSRAVSAEEKSAATFNVYFNDSLVASNISGTYNGTAQVGTRLTVRVDALVNGKRIARGENTITVRSLSNDVDIKLTENRESESTEQGTQQQPAISYRELSTAQEGDVICANGKVLSASDITPELQSQTVAVVYKVDLNARKAWAVGKELSGSAKMWASSSADGYNTNIAALQEENGYTDGSNGLEKLIAEAPDAATDLETKYPAWDYACNYGKNQGLDSFQTGWYLPCKQELKEIYDNKAAIETALAQTGASKTSFVSSYSYYWSSSQSASDGRYASSLNFGDGSWSDDSYSKTNGNYVCAVRQFTF